MAKCNKYSVIGGFLLIGLAITATALADTKSKSMLYAKHKGFMVFLNWHFLENPPVLVVSHFKKIEDKGIWKVYKGSYGAFEDVAIGVCQNKITNVLAKTSSFEGSIKEFMAEWLEDRIATHVSFTKENPKESVFFLSATKSTSPCEPFAQKLANSYQNVALKNKSLDTPKDRI